MTKWRIATRGGTPVATLGLDGVTVAASAVEVAEFEIAGAEHEREPGEGAPWQRALAHAAASIAAIAEPRELWHVVTGGGEPGAPLRVAWLAIARHAVPREAIAAARRGAVALEGVLASCVTYLQPRPVSSGRVLRELLEVTLRPTVISLRRRRWPIAQIGFDGALDRSPGGVLPPWPSELGRWATLAQALASTAGTALVIRSRLAIEAPEAALASAMKDVLDLNQAHQRLLRGRIDESAILQNYETVAAIASARVAALHGPCVAADVSIASRSSIPAHLLAVARSAIVNGSGLPVTLVETYLPDLGLLQPLDPETSPELIASPREAAALLRTFEPPVDEAAPLPCTRARRFLLATTTSSAVPADPGTPIGLSPSRSGTTPVALSEAARLRHVYVVGQTGTGKSTLLLNMITDDIRRGHGVTVLDPHGTLVAEVLDRVPRARADDVVLIDPADPERCTPVNPLSLGLDDPAAYVSLRDRVIDELLDTIDGLYDLRTTGGPMFEQCFRTFMALLMGGRRPQGFSPTIPLLGVLMADTGLQRRLEVALRGDDPMTAATLEQLRRATGESALSSMIPYVTSKTNRFHAHAAARRLLCQPSCIDFDAIIRKRKILLLPLRPTLIGSDAAALLSRVIVLRLGVAAMNRRAGGSEPPHFLYADEFHTFATERFATLLSEARKFRLGLVLAHQYTSQLVRRDSRVLDAVLGNVGTTIAFRVGAHDAALLERSFAPRVHGVDIAAQPNFQAIVRSADAFSGAPFTLQTHDAPDGRVGLAGQIRQLSLLVHGRDRDIVDAEFAQTLSQFRSLSAA